MVKINNLTKKYGSITAVDNISLSLDNGIYGILGANGAGKSTFLNLLTDNIKRTSGEILYNGKDIAELGKHFRKKLGFTPQLQGIYEDFTAGEFMRYTGELKGMKRKECKKQTEELLKIVGLHNYIHRKLGSFSGGMRQRTLLAAAMLDSPELLILDEPTAGLDPEERIHLRNHIAELASERIVLIATHVVDDIECIADRVMIMKKGKLEKFASPRELMDEIQGKVSEFRGSYDEVMSLKKIHKKGQTIRCRDGFIFRTVSDILPDRFETVSDITLEDVYLYYAEGRK